MARRRTPGLLIAAALSLCAAVGPSCNTPRPPAQRLPMELLSNHPTSSATALPTTASLVGVVLGPDGNPVDFALVAAVSVNDDPEDGKAPLITTSLNHGKFEFPALPAGNYGLTVTSPEANAAAPAPAQPGSVPAGSFAGVITATPGDAGPPMLVRLNPPGTVLRGHVTDESGNPLPTALVRAVRESPFEGDHFFAKTDKDGSFYLVVPGGRYFLIAQAKDKRPVRVDVDTGSAKEPRVPPSIDVHLPGNLPPVSKEDLATWISRTGGTPATVEDGPTTDLTSLRDIVGTARIAGLGSASYTGRESELLRQRMFRFLVENMGFSTLLLEADQADVRPLNEFVRTGNGSLPKLLTGLGYFSFDTTEANAFFSWMRAYNEDKKHRVKLRVAGIDVQRTATDATDVEIYLGKVESPLLPTVESTLDRMRDNDLGASFRTRPADEQDKFIADLTSIVEELKKNARVFKIRTSPAAFQVASIDAAELLWAARVYRDETQRGAALADMAQRALNASPRGTKAAIFAHDAYVSKRKGDGGMGAVLADTYKSDYVALGSTFYQGWIRAWDFTLGPTLDRGTKLFRLPPADPDSLEGLLENAAAPMFFGDVRKAQGPLLAWFEARIPMRSISTIFVSDHRARTRTVIKEAFDALVFVRKQSTVTFNDTGRRPAKQEWE